MQQLVLGCKPGKVVASQHSTWSGGDLLPPAHNPRQNLQRAGNLNVMTVQCHLFLLLPDVLIVVGSSCLVSEEIELCKVVKHYPYMFTCFYLTWISSILHIGIQLSNSL